MRQPEELRPSAPARAAAGAGMYGSNPVYRGFEVTGWRVARCKSCLMTVRGGSSALRIGHVRASQSLGARWAWQLTSLRARPGVRGSVAIAQLWFAGTAAR